MDEAGSTDGLTATGGSAAGATPSTGTGAGVSAPEQAFHASHIGNAHTQDRMTTSTRIAL
jgi:hypothetical protein